MLVMILVSLLVVFARFAQAAPRELTPADAVLVMDAGSRPARGTVIRCTEAHQVGLWVTEATPMDLHGVTVENCSVGLVSDAPAPADDLASRALGAATPSITGLTASGPRCLVGLWIRGPLGVTQGNTVSGCDYGIVASGARGLYEGNIITHSRRDGILLLGLGNVVRGNQVSQSGRYGIRAAATVPQLGLRTLLFALSAPAIGNTIEDNVVTESRFADLRQWPALATCRNLENVWQRNTVRTTVPRCLQDVRPEPD